MDKKNAISIANSHKYFSEASFVDNLEFIKTHFGFSPDKITSLEAKQFLLSHAFDAAQNTNLKLSPWSNWKNLLRKNERCSKKILDIKV